VTSLIMKKHLLHRYINNCKLHDELYQKIRDLLYEIIHKVKFVASLEDVLHDYMGDYNIITAQIYHDLADQYLIEHKNKYKTHDIFDVI